MLTFTREMASPIACRDVGFAGKGITLVGKCFRGEGGGGKGEGGGGGGRGR